MAKFTVSHFGTVRMAAALADPLGKGIEAGDDVVGPLPQLVETSARPVDPAHWITEIAGTGSVPRIGRDEENL